MKRENVKSVYELIEAFKKEQRSNSGFHAGAVVNAFSNIVGKNVGYYVVNRYFSNKVLYITLSSSMVRNNLLMNKRGIINKINNSFGSNVLRDIIFR